MTRLRVMRELTRRQFVALTAAAAAGCAGVDAQAEQPATSKAPSAPAPDGPVMDAGTLSDYPDADVYDKFREKGFFVIRRDRQIFALSSICTHKECKVRVADDLSFFCKCHGSKFDRDGHVTRGPPNGTCRAWQ